MATARRARLSTTPARAARRAGRRDLQRAPIRRGLDRRRRGVRRNLEGPLCPLLPEQAQLLVAVVRHSADDQHHNDATSRAARAPVDRPRQGASSTSTPTPAATSTCSRDIGSDEVAAIIAACRSAIATRILDNLPGGEPSPVRSRSAAMASPSGEPRWLERRELSHEELRDLLIQYAGRRDRRHHVALLGALVRSPSAGGGAQRLAASPRSRRRRRPSSRAVATSARDLVRFGVRRTSKPSVGPQRSAQMAPRPPPHH